MAVVDAGHRETPMVELWFVPQGADSPAATPTVDPKEVEVIKKRKRSGG